MTILYQLWAVIRCFSNLDLFANYLEQIKHFFMFCYCPKLYIVLLTLLKNKNLLSNESQVKKYPSTDFVVLAPQPPAMHVWKFQLEENEAGWKRRNKEKHLTAKYPSGRSGRFASGR